MRGWERFSSFTESTVSGAVLVVFLCSGFLVLGNFPHGILMTPSLVLRKPARAPISATTTEFVGPSEEAPLPPELKPRSAVSPGYIEIDPNESTRVAHAKELLGSSYAKSIVRKGEEIKDYDQFINQWLSTHLASKWKPRSQAIASAIIEESQRYAFDPIFLMAVIENESRFNPDIVGTFGELGLMQILPETGRWIAKKYDFEWKGVDSLRDPVTSIRLGSAYLAHLREKFDFHGRLYLAAYNMGTRNVKRNLAHQVWPKTYSNRVMAKYIHFYTEVTYSPGLASAN